MQIYLLLKVPQLLKQSPSLLMIGIYVAAMKKYILLFPEAGIGGVLL